MSRLPTLAAVLLAAIAAGAVPAGAVSPELITVSPDDGLAATPAAQPADATQPTAAVGKAALDRLVAPTGNYDDAIRLSPSVIDVAPNGPGLGEAQILSIRGFTDGQYNVTFDGIPFADSDDFTHHSSAYFVLRDLAGVSVDRGPGDAATIGDATFGGTVALRSINPTINGSLSPTVSLGAFATRSGGVLANTGSQPGGARLAVDLEGAGSEGALDGAGQRRGTAFAKLALPLSPSTTLTLVGNASRTVQNEPPGATRAQITTLGPATALSDDPSSQAFEGYNDSVYRADIAYAALNVVPSDRLELSDTLYTYGLDRRFEQGLDPNGETPNGTALGPDDVPGQAGRNGLRAWGDILRAARTLPAAFTLRTGLWVERQTNARSLAEIDLSAGNAPNPVLSPVPGVLGSAAIDRLQRETLLTLQPFLQLDWQAGRWLRLAAGLKGAWFDRSVAAPVMEGTRLPARFDRGCGAVLPAFTLHVTPAPGWTAYAQVARGFLAPQLQLFDVADPGSARLSPERTWNVQLGGRWQASGLTVAADLYEILFDDAIGVRTVGGESQDFAEGSVTYRGLEGEATRTLAAGLDLYGNGSLNQARQHASAQGGVDGPAPDTPQATLAGGLLFSRRGLNASLLDRWVGASFGDVGRAAPIAPYNQLDLSVGGTLRPPAVPPIRLQAQIFNLLDSRRIDGLAGYTVAAATPLFWTQAGLSFFVGATTQF